MSMRVLSEIEPSTRTEVGGVEVKNPLHLFVERPAALGAVWAGQTDQGVAARDADRDSTVEKLVPKELWNVAFHPLIPEESARGDQHHHKRGNEPDQFRAVRRSKLRLNRAKHNDRQHYEQN